MNPLHLELKQKQIKLVNIPPQCSQKDFVKRSGGNKALHLVVLPFPILSIIISKHETT